MPCFVVLVYSDLSDLSCACTVVLAYTEWAAIERSRGAWGSAKVFVCGSETLGGDKN